MIRHLRHIAPLCYFFKIPKLRSYVSVRRWMRRDITLRALALVSTRRVGVVVIRVYVQLGKPYLTKIVLKVLY